MKTNDELVVPKWKDDNDNDGNNYYYLDTFQNSPVVTTTDLIVSTNLRDVF
jgi:hypothetical protein